jgi:hypothetical protein
MLRNAKVGAEKFPAGQLATNPAIKQAYLDVAKQWRELAERVELLDNSAPDRLRS